ncbi:MAG: ABC transporter ATP-binding protein [Nanobdellota archaeon]
MPIIKVKKINKIFKVPQKENKTIAKKLKHFFFKEYEEKKAIEDISFDIKQGEFIGYIGPNGAGKSTTIKILTGIITPTTGHVSCLGFNPHKQRYNYSKNIGVVFGQRRLLEFDVPVIDSLRLYKAIYELSEKEFEEKIQLYDKVLNLKQYLHIPVRKLSLGERMRCEIAAALLHTPKLVFLDEPTIGLDQVAKEEIRSFLKYINKTFNTTIILTTHDMDDIEALCKRVVLIDKGTMLFDGTLKNLKTKYLNTKTIDIQYNNIKDKTKLKRTLNNKGVNVIKKTNKTIKLSVDKKNNIPSLIRILFEAINVQDILIHEPRLEQIIKNIYLKSSNK